MMTTYPVPGTNAERVLKFVIENPGTPTNNVITKLALNPSVARKCLAALQKRNRILDLPNEAGHHCWTAKGRAL